MDRRHVQRDKNQKNMLHDQNEMHHKEDKIQDDRFWILDGYGSIHEDREQKKSKEEKEELLANF